MRGKRRDYHPSIERVRELFLYDPESGIFRAAGGAGDVVGSPDKKGRLRVSIDGELWYLHNIAWLIHHGEWPAGDVGHRDGNRGNNAIANLRLATRSQTVAARSLNADGATYVARLGLWHAQTQRDGKNIPLGRYPTKEEAHAAYLAWARGEPAPVADQVRRRVRGGVHFHRRDQKWVARLQVDDQRLWLGGFPTEAEARAACDAAVARYFEDQFVAQIRE